MIRVSVRARSPVVRAGLESLVREAGEMEVVGDAGADVLLAEGDPPPPEPDGLPVVVLTPDPKAALRAGARGVLPPHARESEILAAVEAAAAGLIVVHPEYLGMLSAAMRAEPAVLEDPLTPREMDVLRLLAEGQGNKEIAYRLSISEHTVKFHVASLLDKLHASSRTEAVATGVRAGLILL